MEIIPKQWTIGNIILLYKKGGSEHIENYRPISPSSNISKVFMGILKSRLYDILHQNQRRKIKILDRGTIENTDIGEEIIEGI